MPHGAIANDRPSIFLVTHQQQLFCVLGMLYRKIEIYSWKILTFDIQMKLRHLSYYGEEKISWKYLGNMLRWVALRCFRINFEDGNCSRTRATCYKSSPFVFHLFLAGFVQEHFPLFPFDCTTFPFRKQLKAIATARAFATFARLCEQSEDLFIDQIGHNRKTCWREWALFDQASIS